MTTDKILYHDTEFVGKIKVEIPLNVVLATIMNDTGEVKLNSLAKGLHITAISHALVLKNIFADKDDDMASVLTKIPKPIPIDEIKIIAKEGKKKEKNKNNNMASEPIDWLNVIAITLIVITSLILLLFSLPFIIWLWFNFKAKNEKQNSAYYRYRASLFYLSQLGYSHEDVHPQSFANLIDEKFQTDFVLFSNIYQKTKYSPSMLTENEKNQLTLFYIPFIATIKSKISFKERVKKFVNLYQTVNYFSKPKNN